MSLTKYFLVVWRMRKDHKHFNSILACVKACRIPFEDNDNFLVNIYSGKIASEETQSFLLNVFESGARDQVDFIGRCVIDPAAFE